jgi:hypothetical protein
MLAAVRVRSTLTVSLEYPSSALTKRNDGHCYLAENPDVAAYVDAYVADFLGSRTNGAVAHFVIYGANEQRIAHDSEGQAIDLGYLA